jgi:hypothetical protein
MPGNLILRGNLANDGRNGNVLSFLVEAHKMWSAWGGGESACTMVLANVGADD